MILFEESHQHFPGAIRILRTDADRPEEHSISRVALDEGADTFPQEQQRVVIALVL